jgi:gluconokinase
VTVVVGLDIGTTSAKAAAFDAGGVAHAVTSAEYPLREPHPGWAVQDPDAVLEAAIGVLRRTLERAGGAARVAAVACSSAMHSLVGVDAEGRPLTELITWADRRALTQAERLRAERPALHGRTGTPLHPMSPLPKLCWLREHEPDTFAAVARWCGIKELLLHRLTGEWVMDVSIASGTGLMALETLDWDAEALEVAGVRAEQLPPLVPVKATLDWEVPLVVGAGDGPLASLGVGAVRPGVAAVSIGTSGALRVMAEAPAIDPRGRVFCYALTPGRWAVGGAINNGGVVLQWAGQALAPDLGPHREPDLLALAATAPPGCDGLLMLPYLLSERAPHWTGTARGAYVGLKHAHGRPHLIRAAVEGVCLQLALVLASVRDAGNEVREVRATGGFARSAFWRQLLADALGMPVGFPDGHEGSALGAALVGMETLGIVDTIDVAAELVTIDEVVEPEPRAAAVYERLLPTFAGLYDALGPAFLALGEEGRAADGGS